MQSETRKGYGTLPGQASNSVQQSQSRSATQPVASGPVRTNSFDTGDDRRVLSATQPGPAAQGAAQPRQPPSITTRPQVPKTFSQIGISPSGVVASPQTWTPIASQSQSQKPLPKPTPGRPSASSSAAETSAGNNFPPRKSSLSQRSPPQIAGAFPKVANPAPSETTQRSSGQPSDRARSGSVENKPRPFVRPADIYKRIDEEREKERQSLESSRPSMDSLTGEKNVEGTRSRSGSQEPRQADDPIRGHSPASSHGGDGESSRKLMPMLEPVQERKSEYGFDGLVVGNLPIDSSQPPDTTTKDLTKKEDGKDTSPRLPTVSRVSGFGDDFFSTTGLPATTPKGDGKPLQPDLQSTSKASEADLHHQPSQGFRSVVHQAFDKSVPQTPSSLNGSSVSQTSSAVRRADTSSSSGVSPIISRNPSGANIPPRGQDPIGDHSINSTIAEEPNQGTEMSNQPFDSNRNEPNSSSVARKAAPVAAASSESLPPAFKPGHRRDLSTPSPNNSPARSPIVEGPENIESGNDAEIAHVASETTKSAHISSDESLPFKAERIDAQRGEGLDYSLREADIASATKTSPEIEPTGIDSAERAAQASFLDTHRPSENDLEKSGRGYLPEALRVESPTAAKGLEPAARSEKDSLPARPTTDRNESFRPVLPGGWQSFAPTPVGETTTNPLEKAALQGHGSTSMMPPPLNRRMDSDELSLRTPRMPVQRLNSASSGVTMTSDAGPNPYSSNAVDPRLDQAQYQNRALRPSQLQHSLSSDSSIPPTPPPKNTPPVGAHSPNHPDYFGAPQPLQQRAVKQSAAQRDMPAPIDSQVTPALSTDASPHDQESDTLRKEIVKSLSPQATSAPVVDYGNPKGGPTARMRSDASRLTDLSTGSGVLPSEYDSYWATTDEGADTTKEGSVKTVGHDGIPKPEAQSQSYMAISPPDSSSKEKPLPIRSLSDEKTLDASSTARPDLLQPRFSWETEPEMNTSPKGRNAETPPGDTTSIGAPRVASPSDVPASKSAVQAGEDEAIPQGLELADEAHHSRPDHTAHEAVTGFERTSPTKSLSDLTPGSTSNEQDFGRYMESSFGGQATTDSFRNAKIARDPSSPTMLSNSRPSSGPSISNAPPTASQRIPAFREIVAIKTPGDRITAYRETQEQFATMETGLSQWIFHTASSHPDHAHFLSRGNLSSTTPASGQVSSPGRLPHVNSNGSQPPQGPHQPYINAAISQSPVGAGRASGPGSANSPVGQSPGGPKMSGQQVQTKGKELLHTAGVFGGKANTAAKGLFAKGKSRLRGSEKVDT
jgi:hypothetical protein